MVSSLCIHTDIVNDCLVNNSDAKCAFLRASKTGEVGTSCLTPASEGHGCRHLPCGLNQYRILRGERGVLCTDWLG